MRVVIGQQQGTMTLLSHPSNNKNSKNLSSCATTTTAFPIAQVMPGCLYFTSFATRAGTADTNVPKNDAKTIYIDIDSHVHYDAFYDDFGPLNLAVLYRFCQFLHTLVLQHNSKTAADQQHSATAQKKRLFLYTSADPQCRVNAVFLIASYMIIYHHLTAEQAYLRLQSAEPPPFVGFRDAALGPPSYLLHVQHVIKVFNQFKSIEKALKFKWLDFSRFDADEYEHFERVENGDLNWIVPGKLLSFCGPHDRSYVENGYPYHSPEVYFDYFRAHNVSTIVRLNKKIYDAKRFTDAGFAHHDLFFIDGSTPNEDIVLRFLDVVESTKGAIAVHCKAGLGRTGCMIACWMMKHYRLTAPQCMGWLRVCRPGSVIGPQQQFLIEKQAWCWGLAKTDGLWNSNSFHGLESEEEEEEDYEQKMPKMNGMSNNNRPGKEALMAQETALNEAGQSQGDRLCEIKARTQLRHQQQQHRQQFVETTGGGATTTTAPSSSSKFVAPSATKATATPSSTNNLGSNCCFSSATTPIKQLKLSSTVGGHAPPAFVKIHSNLGNTVSSIPTHRRHISSPTTPLEQQQQQQQEKPTSTASSSSNNNNNKPLVLTPTAIHHHPQRTKNPIALINRLPIQKVSVSSTGRHYTFQAQSTTPSRVQLHRKHFSATARLKPYQPSECETAHRFASELASTAQASAQNNYGKSLKKQYIDISAACQQQKRHKKPNQLIGGTNFNDTNGANICCSSSKGTMPSSSSAAVPWLSHVNGDRHPMLLPHKSNEHTTNSGTNCNYELRPRDQLHSPARFASEQPMLPQLTVSNGISNRDGISALGSGGGGPYFLARHQKASKSATAFFPTT